MLHFSDDNGAIGYSDPVTASTVFARVSDWFTVPAGETLDSPVTGVAWRTAATLATTFWVDGVQIEPHTFATPYLATNGDVGHRGAGRLFAPATAITNTQGWVALRFRASLSTGDLSASEQPYAFRWADDSSHYISLSLNSGGQWVLARANGSNTDNVSVPAGSFSPGAIVKLVAAWTTTGLNLSLNGAAFTTVTASSGSVPPLAAKTFDIGSDGQGAALDGDISWFAAGLGTLGSLTAFTDADPLLSSLPGSASFDWSADTPNYQSTGADYKASYSYDDAYNKLTMTSPNGNTTSYGYDALSRLTSTSSPLSEVTTTAYDALGRVKTRTDANGNHAGTGGVTSYGYDADGNKQTVTDSRGTNPHTAGYDAAGRLTSVEDANLHTTGYGYDLNGNQTTIIGPDGRRDVHKTVLAYDNAGDLSSRTDPLNNETQYGYDSAGRLNQTTLPTGEKTSTVWDAAGNKYSSTDAADQVTHYSYDADNQLLTTTTPLSEKSSVSYDPNGNVATRTNELGQTTSYGYDWANRLVTDTDPLGDSTSTTYDQDGNRLTRTDALGNTTRWTYDQDDRVQHVTGPDGDSSHYTALSYDRNGNVVKSVDPLGHETDYSYYDSYFQDDHLEQKQI